MKKAEADANAVIQAAQADAEAKFLAGQVDPVEYSVWRAPSVRAAPN